MEVNCLTCGALGVCGHPRGKGFLTLQEDTFRQRMEAKGADLLTATLAWESFKPRAQVTLIALQEFARDLRTLTHKEVPSTEHLEALRSWWRLLREASTDEPALAALEERFMRNVTVARLRLQAAEKPEPDLNFDNLWTEFQGLFGGMHKRLFNTNSPPLGGGILAMDEAWSVIGDGSRGKNSPPKEPITNMGKTC